MAATELQDLSGMEEVYRQQKDKLVFQSILGINPSTSSQGTQTHIIWKYVESTQYLTTVKTDLHERVNDSELTKESLKNDKEKMKTDTGFHILTDLFYLALYKATPQRNNASHSIYLNHHLLVLMRANLMYSRFIIVLVLLRYFSEVMHILNERLDCPSIRQFIGEIV